MRAFEAECRALQEVVDGLAESDFVRPTNCPPWTVKELIVHIAIGLPAELSIVDKPLTLHEPADYYRRPERSTTEYHQTIADNTRTAAATLPSGPAAAELLRERWQAAFRSWARMDPGAAVELPAGVSRLADYVVTRVLAHAAHGLDLAISLDREPWTTAATFDQIRPVFVSLLGKPPPDALEWDDQRFLAVATGRQRLSAAEHELLGADADVFPLLS